MSGLSADDRAAIELAAEAYVAAMNAADWRRVARSFSDGGVRIPPNEEPHQGREEIERWLGGIEQLSSYELIRDRIDGAVSRPRRVLRANPDLLAAPGVRPNPTSDNRQLLRSAPPRGRASRDR